MEHLGKSVFEPESGMAVGTPATRGRDSLFLMAQLRVGNGAPV